MPVASLAKEREEIFIPQRARPVVLPHSSRGLQLLQRLRDEAHRFAIGYHRRVHKKRTFASTLDTIPGIGPKRKRNLRDIESRHSSHSHLDLAVLAFHKDGRNVGVLGAEKKAGQARVVVLGVICVRSCCQRDAGPDQPALHLEPR